MTDPALGQALTRHYQAALQAGMADDSREIDKFLETALMQEKETRHQRSLNSNALTVGERGA